MHQFDRETAQGLNATICFPARKENEAAREILAKASPEEWACWVRLAMELVCLAEQVDQAAEVWWEVRRAE
jgi:hypothetical protein